VSATPPSARILDGAALAKRLRADARAAADALSATGRRPHLRVLLLGTDPASETYVASKTRAAREAGCTAETVRLPDATSPGALLAEVDRANRDASVDGVLVQLPLPPPHDPRRVFDAIDPWKDVDGVTPHNVGLLHQDRPRFTPCTPAGVVALLDEAGVAIRGSNAVVLGRSEIVGKPLAALLTARDATVTTCHSKTRNVLEICAKADILIAAIGRPAFVTADHVRPGAAVIDVGINRITSLDGMPASLQRSERVRRALAEKGTALVGDVDFDGVSRVAGWISPVPGGVGPLTVAILLANTILATRLGRDRHAAEELDPLTL
jgi:methylenetetrahydrofolate dehydrogenase (NADP+)/methenyltetrahydrofolate cyclohydrolase